MPDGNGRAVLRAILVDWLVAIPERLHRADLATRHGIDQGAILVPGRRNTVASALRVAGLDQTPHFTNHHRVLNRNRWSARWLSRCLLGLLIAAFVPPDQPVVIGLDDTIERRWGAAKDHSAASIATFGAPERSFRQGERFSWLSVMLLPEIGWAGRCWALPFLTVLAPSQRYWQEHKTSGTRS